MGSGYIGGDPRFRDVLDVANTIDIVFWGIETGTKMVARIGLSL